MSAGSTVEAILDGAGQALGRRGVRKLSMSEICDAAGVSRGTLYRYFKSKDDVLEALGQHVLGSMTTILEEAVAHRPDEQLRLRVVIEAMMSFAERLPYTAAIVQTEPGFALTFFQRAMPTFREILERFLTPVFAGSAPVTSRALTAAELCELFERVVLTCYLIPPSPSAGLPARTADMWESLVAYEGAPARLQASSGG